ncbi:MAG TPA: type II toxin-antitoxin system PemK/MazF family toxin [Bryobacteraceae bacterium]|jgi:mRNA-degrading endonuclease toxin of MazEF toxin-antitoxin module|nr:type II toxin-antitoxin system PemK/MazF family toxin [Bryobacteraceae bacterium]
MKRGEIWLVGLDPTMGHEQKGRRPPGATMDDVLATLAPIFE